MIQDLDKRGDFTNLFVRTGNIFARVLETLAVFTLFGMMAMTTLDVAGRYFFSAPLGFAFEMTELGMAALVFTALPGITARSSHVTVALFESFFKGRFALARDSLVALVSAAGCAFLCWRTWILAERFDSYGDLTSMLQVPIAPFAYGGAIAWGLAAAAALGIAGSAAGRFVQRNPQ